MKHAKRMILVPEDVLARLERKQKQEMSALVTNLMNVDENMEEILRRTDINDGEKQKLYYANLERYMNLKHQKNNDFPTVNVASKSTTLDGNIPGDRREGTRTETLNDSTIVDSIPKSMRNRAVSILNRD